MPPLYEITLDIEDDMLSGEYAEGHYALFCHTFVSPPPPTAGDIGHAERCRNRHYAIYIRRRTPRIADERYVPDIEIRDHTTGT